MAQFEDLARRFLSQPNEVDKKQQKRPRNKGFSGLLRWAKGGSPGRTRYTFRVNPRWYKTL
jgi:hypothetical protein